MVLTDHVTQILHCLLREDLNVYALGGDQKGGSRKGLKGRETLPIGTRRAHPHLGKKVILVKGYRVKL